MNDCNCTGSSFIRHAKVTRLTRVTWAVCLMLVCLLCMCMCVCGCVSVCGGSIEKSGGMLTNKHTN